MCAAQRLHRGCMQELHRGCMEAACRSANGESYSGPWKRDKRDGTNGTSALVCHSEVNLCVGFLTAAVLTAALG